MTVTSICRRATLVRCTMASGSILPTGRCRPVWREIPVEKSISRILLRSRQHNHIGRVRRRRMFRGGVRRSRQESAVRQVRRQQNSRRPVGRDRPDRRVMIRRTMIAIDRSKPMFRPDRRHPLRRAAEHRYSLCNRVHRHPRPPVRRRHRTPTLARARIPDPHPARMNGRADHRAVMMILTDRDNEQGIYEDQNDRDHSGSSTAVRRCSERSGCGTILTSDRKRRVSRPRYG